MAPTLNPVKRHRQRCREVTANMSDYLDGDLDTRTQQRVRRHLSWCATCSRTFTSLSRTVAGLRALRGLSPIDRSGRRP